MSEDTTPVATQATTTTPTTSTATTGVKPGHKTSEAILGLLAIIVGATLASGLIVNNTAVQIGGIVQMVLASLGYTWSRTMIKTAAPLLLLWLGLAATQPGCAWFASERKAVASDLVDCTRGAAPDAIKQFGPVVDALLVYATGGDGHLSADAVKDVSKGFAKEVGGCVLADAVARALAPKPAAPDAPKSSPLEADPASLRAALAATYPGVKFRTASGMP